MPSRTTLQVSLVAALAGIAMTASTAAARPIDRVDRLDNAAPRHYQDLRGEHARDAARAAEEEHFLPGQPTWPTHPGPAGKPDVKPVTRVAASDGNGGIDDVWLIVGAGLATAGLVGGSAAGVARRSRVRARRAIA